MTEVECSIGRDKIKDTSVVTVNNSCSEGRLGFDAAIFTHIQQSDQARGDISFKVGDTLFRGCVDDFFNRYPFLGLSCIRNTASRKTKGPKLVTEASVGRRSRIIVGR